MLRLVASGGTDAVTHRAAAAEAAVPLAATTYYFASRDDLLAQALTHAAERRIERLTALPARADADAAAVTRYVLAAVERDREDLAAEWALHLLASRTPALRAVARRCTEAYRGIAEELLRAAGSTAPAADSALLVAAIDGLMLEGGVDDLPRLVERLVAALLTA